MRRERLQEWLLRLNPLEEEELAKWILQKVREETLHALDSVLLDLSASAISTDLSSRKRNPERKTRIPPISTENTMIPTISRKQTVNLYVRASSWSAEIFLLTTTQTTVSCGQTRG
jgi:hypothetical protein